MKLAVTTPTSSEIEDQLARMLASRRFRNAENQSKFLALVVRRALEGKKTSGYVIAKELFPDKLDIKPDGKIEIIATDVRATASNLRKTLRRYQADEGREDPLIISLPKPSEDRTARLPEGEAYTPQFDYSPIHSVVREMRLGEHFYRRGLIEDEERAFAHFSRALSVCPHHIEAAIGVMESSCSLLEWGQALDDAKWRVSTDQAARVLDLELMRGSTYWRLYAAMGNVYFHLGGERIDQAGKHFTRAKLLDRESTESYLPYLDFLIFGGDKHEALTLSEKYLEAHEDDIRAYTTRFLALALSKKFDEAQAVLERALIIDKSNTQICYYIAQFRLWRHRDREALPHIELMKALTDDRSFRKTAGELAKRFALPAHLLKNDLLPPEVASD